MFELVESQKKDSLGIAIVNVYTWKTQYIGIMPEELINSRIQSIMVSEERIASRIKAGDKSIAGYNITEDIIIYE